MDIPKIKSVELSSPHLTWISHDLYDIAGRIREIEPGYFIMRNHRTGKFEVHSTDNKGKTTYCFTVPYDELDARTLAHCRETSVTRWSAGRFSEMMRHNDALDEKKERRFAGDIEAASREAATDVSLGVEKDQTHSGYMRSHYMGGRKRDDRQGSSG
jgi:hypothetical protein